MSNRLPKQTPNPVPEIGTRWYAKPTKGSPPGTPPRVIVIKEIRFDTTRNDTRIFYANDGTKLNGSTLYDSFKSGAAFWPVPAKEQVVAGPPVAETVPPVPVAAEHTATHSPPVQPTQLPLTVATQVADPRVIALLERIAAAVEDRPATRAA